jgi:hypothetical protein
MQHLTIMQDTALNRLLRLLASLAARHLFSLLDPTLLRILSSSFLRRKCNVQRATCNVQRATCNVQRATCNVQRATCNVQRATCNVQRSAPQILRGRGSAAHLILRGSAAQEEEQLRSNCSTAINDLVAALLRAKSTLLCYNCFLGSTAGLLIVQRMLNNLLRS